MINISEEINISDGDLGARLIYLGRKSKHKEIKGGLSPLSKKPTSQIFLEERKSLTYKAQTFSWYERVKRPFEVKI